MPRNRLVPIALFAALTCAWPPAAAPAADEPVDLGMMTRIRDEGLDHSRVMATAGHLTDVIGPRLTASPAAKEANDWTRQQFADWGLANAHLEAWKFGRGWTWTHASVAMTSPRHAVLQVYPKAWSTGTAGPIRGDAMQVTLGAEKDFDAYRGKLAGKVLLLDNPGPPRTGALPGQRATGRRLTSEDLAEIAQFNVPGDRPVDFAKRRAERIKLRQALTKFLVDEKVLATIESSSLGWGEMGVSGTGYFKAEDGDGVPAFVIASESYHMLARLLEAGEKVQLEVELVAEFHDGDGLSYNTIAEIPGGDRRGEVVMAGAHLDSWHTGTGATDNAAGCAVVMEAARILTALGVKPRRTIRFALWTGEEEGLYGSNAYVAQHFAARPETAAAAGARGAARKPAKNDVPDPTIEDENGPPTFKPEHAKLSAYFNVDNGSGKVRGIFAQQNTAAAPIFTSWLAPFHDLGAATVSLRSVGSTDHVPFDRAGLPGFQFIQDPLDYMGHTHHTSMDVYDHLEREDLMQAAVVLAAFLYDAAERPEMMPRKPLPPPAAAAAPKAAAATPKVGAPAPKAGAAAKAPAPPHHR
jgi:carboxypeptidase Q